MHVYLERTAYSVYVCMWICEAETPYKNGTLMLSHVVYSQQRRVEGGSPPNKACAASLEEISSRRIIECFSQLLTLCLVPVPLSRSMLDASLQDFQVNTPSEGGDRRVFVLSCMYVYSVVEPKNAEETHHFYSRRSPGIKPCRHDCDSGSARWVFI